jgi:hypothetical protein
MIQRRLLSFIFILLFAFAQQQALVHPYVHLASEQGSTSQESSTNDKHGQTHSEVCAKCITLAGVGSAVSSDAPSIHVLPATFELAYSVFKTFFSTAYCTYHSRAPPYSKQM